MNLTPSAFLHFEAESVYNPLTDRTLNVGQPGYEALRELAGDEESAAQGDTLEGLERDGWLVEAGTDESRRFYLKYVALEAHTVCNQACYFCPVSIDPRKDYFMSSERYAAILEQLTEFKETIEGVFMINYNEPTLDRRFVEQVRTIKSFGLPAATLTNGTGLTPKRIDALVEMGGLRYLSINLSTLDRERYAKDRGQDQLELVMRNLEYARDREVAEQMDIVVLGTGDENHRLDSEQIKEHFRDSRFRVRDFEVMDRAGYLEIGLKATGGRELRGCDNIGSRPLQHLHITPYSKCVLCCEDYDEVLEIGDLAQQTVREVLEGDVIAAYRRQIYGIEEAPADFICRKCVFARTCGAQPPATETQTLHVAST